MRLAPNAELYMQVRERTVAICADLQLEDYCVQSHWFVSPPKWHLGHTTWFWDVFCLRPRSLSRTPRGWDLALNSYYQSQGSPLPQAGRGVRSRPTIREIMDFRRQVDESMVLLLQDGAPDSANANETRSETWGKTFEVGIHHEQQHQELLCMDIKALLAMQTDVIEDLRCLSARVPDPVSEPGNPNRWWRIASGIYEIGDAGQGFAFDNERARHRVFLEAFEVRQELVTNAEYLEFMRADGYSRPELWLSVGWDWLHREGTRAPLYWRMRDEEWWEFDLDGWKKLDPDQPVRHVSYFEADACARWMNSRLPTEAEWETVASRESGSMHRQLWQWTQSAYLPYPGFRPFQGALGEYNGKFMNGQMVLRGGSVATPPPHYRVTYRNFFPPELRWQFSGIRLAR
ncbi:MAG: ergothioneine biosynthesis protein EgtB [Bdellovibrionaceae bacterium]|nr:ergothioneine biosynthesis protein EgtB [Pseudobdellovibrionaceae bacterium]